MHGFFGIVFEIENRDLEIVIGGVTKRGPEASVDWTPYVASSAFICSASACSISHWPSKSPTSHISA